MLPDMNIFCAFFVRFSNGGKDALAGLARGDKDGNQDMNEGNESMMHAR